MNQPVNPIETLVGQYKQGYKTSEFWVALAAGVGPALTAAFDGSKPVTGQLSNLTWVAIAYVLARAGLKVVRVNSQAKVAAAVAASAPAGSEGAGAADVAWQENENGFQALDALVDLRDRGILSEEQYDLATASVGSG